MAIPRDEFHFTYTDTQGHESQHRVVADWPSLRYFIFRNRSLIKRFRLWRMRSRGSEAANPEKEKP